MIIPNWNQYYPDLDSANEFQKKYYKIFQSGMVRGEFIEIDGNLSYIFLYLYETVNNFIKDKRILLLVKKFELINNFYGELGNVEIYINEWLKDAYIYIQDYENAWEYLKKCKNVSIQDIIYIRGNCGETSINSLTLFNILGSNTGLTKFGKSHIKEISLLVDLFLKDFHFEKKKNLIEFFLNQYDFGNLMESDFKELSEFFPNEKDYLLWKNTYLKTQKSKFPHPKKYNHHLFSGVPTESPTIERMVIPYLIMVALENEFKRIFREAENTVRVEKELPKVGEGWISETELFYKISNYYKDEKVIHHGKPLWLKRQHLDIYFPKRNIGIEYQGLQHLEPVAYFGGLKSFEKQQKMDKKKKRLCEANDCKLIYVYENYDFEELVRQIDTILYSAKMKKE